jgi:uncharacterized membrane protein YphA (DoxX/SURF4 family)
MVMLVLLRLNIGWHFYSEGTKHLTDPNWSSEGFLRQAKGPLAPRFQAVLPDYHKFEAIVYTASDEKEAGEAWIKQVGAGWDDYRRQFSDFYGLSDQQKAQSEAIVQRRQELLREWLADNQEAIATHVHERQRMETAETDPAAGDVPFKKKRIADQAAKLKTQANGWIAHVKSMETDLHKDLAGALDDQQRQRGPLPREKSELQKIDMVMTYGIWGIGVCLILGLFTRLAALAGAAFLLSVVLTQPFWITDATPTFNQFVEMFALLTLATTHVGRWGGLDFFIHYLFVRPFTAKGKSDASYT